MTFRLITPDPEHLPGFRAALERGWSPDNTRPEAAGELLQRVDAAPGGFVAGLHDPEARGGPIRLPDGSTSERLPGTHRWMWDGEFCGQIGFRWRPGTSDLPPRVLGHIGYAVVPWKRGNGYATRALGLLLPEAVALGLPWVDLTTDDDNIPSQNVILNNGGYLVERFRKPAEFGGGPGLRYRIDLAG